VVRSHGSGLEFFYHTHTPDYLLILRRASVVLGANNDPPFRPLWGLLFKLQASSKPNHQSFFRDDSHSDAAAWSNNTKDWPSGLCVPGGLGAENVSGSTVFCSHPWLSMLSWTSRSAAIAAGICVLSPAMHAKRKVDAAKSVVEDVSANESGWSM
jgi:hypothetical protein